MTGPVDLLLDGLARVREVLHEAVEGVAEEDLTWQPGPAANTLGWLAWHLARVQDSQIADVAESEQVWTAGGWAGRLALPFDPSATGYGQDPAEVTAVLCEPGLLIEYYDAVHARTEEYLRGLGADELDRVVDERWDPPVTLAVRLVSIIADDLQHAGQAAYLRGLLDRR